jgi:hypothetical protein
MKLLSFLSLVCLLSFSQVLFAAGPVEHKYTPKEQIEFAPSTKAAFDHSGASVIHSTLPDGSRFADHNGSMGNVTVARLGADGSMETFCTSDEDAARAWMAGEDIGKKSTLSTVEVISK